MKITNGNSLNVELTMSEGFISSPGPTHNHSSGQIGHRSDELRHTGDWPKWKAMPLRGRKKKSTFIWFDYHFARRAAWKTWKNEYLGVNNMFSQQLSMNHNNKLGWRETSRACGIYKPSLPGCQVMDARPQVQYGSLKQWLFANYKLRQRAAVKDTTLSVS